MSAGNLFAYVALRRLNSGKLSRPAGLLLAGRQWGSVATSTAGRAPRQPPAMGKKDRHAERSGASASAPVGQRAVSATTSSFVQVVGIGGDTGGTSPSVLLFFDQRRYLFNVGEGFQRLAAEHKIRLSKINHFFFTRVCSETAGGVPGMLLTLAETAENHEGLALFGPARLKGFVDAFRNYVSTRVFGLQLREIFYNDSAQSSGEVPVYEDDLVKISAVVLKAPTSEPTLLEDVEHAPVLDVNVVNGDNSSPVKRAKLMNVREPHEHFALVYICQLPPIPGKFDPVQARKLGVKPGPLFGQLQRGESIKLDDGRMVRSSDVMGPSTPGPVLIVTDCPSEAYLPSLLAAPRLQVLRTDESTSGTEKAPACVVHLSPAEVLQTPEYQHWVQHLSSLGATHIDARAASKQPAFLASSRLQAKLNRIQSDVFPLAHPVVLDASPSLSLSSSPAASVDGVEAGENLLKSTVPAPLELQDVLQELEREVPDVMAAIDEVPSTSGTSEEDRDLPACLQGISRQELEVVFLGTGSAIPSKYRNVSGIYLNFFGRGGMLLDCGEGSFGQLQRRYGSEGANEAIVKLRCIWISHIHADHHAGLSHILALRRKLLGNECKPLPVIGPWPLRNVLAAFGMLEEFSATFIDCVDTLPWTEAKPVAELPSRVLAAKAALKEPLSQLGLKRLTSVEVQHCANAFGIVLEAVERTGADVDTGEPSQQPTPGWKLVYSGDTRPCERLVEASKGATVLIHEATFDDGMLEEALAKRHSLTKEAVEVGVRAGAWRTILTHFSQRYPKIPVIDESYTAHTCIAFDLMSVNLADLWLLPKLLPPLKLLFKDELMEAEEQQAVGA
eukprot:jgi/Chlat1/8441/Chrsp80S07923